MMRLPEYVAAGRYLDGWLIQFSAFRLVDAPDAGNPFLAEMFEYGLEAWASQVDSSQEALFAELGINPSEMMGMGIDEAEAWFEEQIADPEKKARMEAYYEENPMLSDQTGAELWEWERASLRLLDREDAERLLLSPEEVGPWIPTLEERLAPFGGTVLDLAERDEAEAALVEALSEVVLELSKEMALAIFTPDRLDRLAADLNAYRSELWDAGETEASRYAHAIYAVFQREDRPAEHPFLAAVCFATLRVALIAALEAARGGEAE